MRMKAKIRTMEQFHKLEKFVKNNPEYRIFHWVGTKLTEDGAIRFVWELANKHLDVVPVEAMSFGQENMDHPLEGHLWYHEVILRVSDPFYLNFGY